MKISPYGGFPGPFVDTGMPNILRPLRISYVNRNAQRIIFIRLPERRIIRVIYRNGLIQRTPVEIDIPYMLIRFLSLFRRLKPVSKDAFFEWIKIAEHIILDHSLPHPWMTVNRFPAPNALRSSNHRPRFVLSRLISNTFRIAQPAARWIRPFPIHSGMHRDRISWSRDTGSSRNGAKRIFRITAIAIVTIRTHMIFSCHHSRPFLLIELEFHDYRRKRKGVIGVPLPSRSRLRCGSLHHAYRISLGMRGGRGMRTSLPRIIA